MRSWHQTVLFALLLITLASVAGCGPSAATIKGTVTFQDKPIDYGSVVFIVNDKESVKADLQPDGSYIAKEVPYGQAKIEVYSRQAGPATPPPKHTKRPPKELPPPVDATKGTVIPAMYNDKEKSGLTLTIDRSQIDFPIELKEAKEAN